ncbi:Cytochrome P450 [Pseudarcicella hirudinis]|uniref:Cytochrome P450 n=1 Tax=Pseudarcicella hirudinis TaxID=1079859 RepID=A0A1I5NZG9_9BACT|nr:cytochrome P450 [Pseudarcicella hirudinis]SFP26671.1 Cytochrome P450 [Pseudarcicella hirudinis]
MQPVPEIKGLPFLGHALALKRDPLSFLMGIQKNHDPIALLRIGNFRINFVMTAELAKYVLQENNKNYIKGRAYRILSLMLGQGLLTSNGDFWHRQRKLAQPAFYKQRLSLLVDTMHDESQLMVERLKKEIPENSYQTIAVSKIMMETTLMIVTKSLFGTFINQDKIASISKDIDILNQLASDRFSNPVSLPLWFPSYWNFQFKSSSKRVAGLIDEIIETRRSALQKNPDKEFNDLMQMLITAKDEESGEQMSNKQLRDEMLTIFIAGHETTAVGMSWTLYLLSRHPEVMLKLREEIEQVLGKEGKPSIENLRSLVYTMQVIQEVMRLYPPAWAVTREIVTDDNLADYKVSKGEAVMISTYALHRNPKYWKDPEVFNPENFSAEQVKERPGYAYLPFGGGPRLCIGNNFALMEMQIMLIELVRNFDFQFIEEVVPEPLVTLKPKGGLKLNIFLRKL